MCILKMENNKFVQNCHTGTHFNKIPLHAMWIQKSYRSSKEKNQSLTNASSFFEQQEISREMSDWKPVRLGE